MRRLCLGTILLLAIVAAIVSNRVKPMAIEPHTSGQWAFEKADYRACVTVRPPPLRPARTIGGRKAVAPIA